MVPELTVQVVNYETAEYLRPCLASVLAALGETPVSSRVAVLDNASSDDLTGIAADFGGAVDVISGTENLGFGGGQNLLAARHASPLICCVNPDVVAEQRDVFARLLTAFEDPAVAVAGPLLRTPSGEPQRFDHGELRGWRARIANGAGHAHWQPRAERAEAAWVSGAFLLVRRSAFAEAGGFDEGFFLYKEEEDLCLRIRHAGGRVLYCPDAEARHVGSVVAHRDPAHLDASVARYQAKHYPGARRRLLDAVYRNVSRRI
ncbi:MAG: family 2 glycosyl transferase [Solirubrobacterales bacterium]|nr:family 2 glycosyl transferase [Solirubrobacterales bacterium]